MPICPGCGVVAASGTTDWIHEDNSDDVLGKVLCCRNCHGRLVFRKMEYVNEVKRCAVLVPGQPEKGRLPLKVEHLIYEEKKHWFEISSQEC